MVELNSERLYKSYLNFIAIRNSMVYVQSETFRRNDHSFLKVIGFPYIGEISKDRKSFIGTKMDSMVQSINELIILGLVSDFEKIVFGRVETQVVKLLKLSSKNTHRNLFLNSLLTL